MSSNPILELFQKIQELRQKLEHSREHAKKIKEKASEIVSNKVSIFLNTEFTRLDMRMVGKVNGMKNQILRDIEDITDPFFSDNEEETDEEEE
jgi:hypothetical protein